MWFPFALLSASLVLVAVFLALYLIERSRVKRLLFAFSTECLKISEALGKVSYGDLDQRLEGPKAKVPPRAAEAFDALAAVENSFNGMTGEPLRRLCYVGTDAWLEGSRCAAAVGERLASGGRVAVVVTSNLGVLIMAQRYRSFVSTLADRFPKIELRATLEAGADQEKVRAYVKKIAGEVDAIYVTGNSMAPAAAAGLEDASRAGKVFLLCHDLDGPIAAKLAEGSISASLVCSTFAQGRDSVLHVFNHIVVGWKPIQPRLLSPLELVTKANLGRFWDEASKRRLAEGDRDGDAMVCLKAAPRKIRIVVFLEDWNSAFLQVKAGILDAGEILRPYNGELVLHTLNQAKRPKAEVLKDAERLLESEAKEGIDGIASYVGIPELVPILNRRIAKGIPVATFNSEPLNLRSMVLWLMQSSAELTRFSDEYKIAHQEIVLACRDILSTIHEMVGRSAHEAETAQRGALSVHDLMELVDSTVLEEKRQLETVSISSDIGGKLSEMIGFFEGKAMGLRTISQNVSLTGTKIDAMGKYSERIRSIIGIIGDITAQTNLLAFNAAIEASRAGESGKGFKVIANEIRKLADKSDESAKSVSALVSNILKAIEESIGSIGATREIAEEQVLSITEASAQLRELSGRLIGTMRDLRAASDRNIGKTLGMKEAADGMNGVLGEVSKASTENSSAIESLSGNFAEIGAQIEEMNTRTRQLGEIVLVLKGVVSQFDTGG